MKHLQTSSAAGAGSHFDPGGHLLVSTSHGCAIVVEARRGFTIRADVGATAMGVALPPLPKVLPAVCPLVGLLAILYQGVQRWPARQLPI